MTYSELKLLWRSKLETIYDQDECDNLFYLTCYHIKQWGRSRVLFEKDNHLTEEDEKAFAEILKPLLTHFFNELLRKQRACAHARTHIHTHTHTHTHTHAQARTQRA